MSTAIALIVAASCNQSEFDDEWPDLPDEPDGPGSPAWGDEDVSCDDNASCAPNEVCLDHVCQMARCDDGPYDSAAPLPSLHYFYSDREIVAADADTYSGSYWVDGYRPDGSGMEYPSGGGSWDLGGQSIVDVAGGNLLGTRPEGFAAAREGSTRIAVAGPGGTAELSVGFVPVAVAAGDVDNDSVDEVIALAANGRFKVCNADTGDCDGYEFSGSVEGLDVGAGDIDGDGYAEPVFLIDAGGSTQIVGFNVDAELTGQPNVVGGGVPTDYVRIDAGDLDGDGLAEVIALDDAGWFDFASDHLHTYLLSDAGATRGSETSVDGESTDVAIADLDMDGTDEVVLLYDTRSVDAFDGSAGGSLSRLYTSELTVSSAPHRIAAVDFDGDSPSARAVAGPALVPGAVVPTMALHFPPYSRTYSDDLPYLFVGDSQTQSEAFIDSVSLRLGVDVGVEAGIAGLFKAKLSAKLQQRLVSNVYTQTEYVVGSRFNVEPNVEMHGLEYGVVVLSSGCFHAYTYELDDPADKLGGDGGEFVIVVPVGGQTTIWSTKRYNAMAEAVGGLPIIDVSYELGDPSSYPTSPTRVDGSPVPAEDQVFPDVPTYLVSDVGKVGWWLSVAEREIQEFLMETELSVASAINVGGVSFGGDIGAGWGKGYQLSIGTEALFGGAVPPISDDPSTPEDEYEAHAFSFAPFVYRQRYEDVRGEDAAYYVLSFAVGM